MKAYWENLTQRDKYLIIFISIISLLYLIYAAAYTPFWHAIALKKQQINEDNKTLFYMKQVKSAPHSQIIPPAGNALTTINSTFAQTFKPDFVYHIAQNKNREIQIKFDRVVYLKFLTTLWRLQHQQHFVIKTLNFIPLPQPGEVRVSATLQL